MKEYYDQLRRRTLLELESIRTKKKNVEEVNKIDDYLLYFSKPSVFSGKSSLEIKFEKQFDELCMLVTEQTSCDSKGLTVLSFYNALNYIKKKAKSNKNGK